MNPNANVSQSNLLQQRLTQQRMGVSQAGPQMQPRPGQQQMMVNSSTYILNEEIL